MTRETIYIPKKAYALLEQRSRKERGCKPLTEEQMERKFSRMHRSRVKGEMIRVDDDSLGGGDGTYYGRWTSWTVPMLKKMVEELGYTWEQGEVEEYYNVVI